MKPSRRQFLHTSSAVAAGFFGLRTFLHPGLGWAEPPEDSFSGYGALLTDPEGILDLPCGFSYKIISRMGQTMDDGLLVPGAPDGMAAFEGPFGFTVLIRNHELEPDNTGPWGEKRELVSKADASRLFDTGHAKTQGSGGTTTLVYDTKRQRVVREFLSIGGTMRNCAGGPTPWNSWITCEETVVRRGEQEKYVTEKDHGYNFEVPANSKMELADPIPLSSMGRFNHEAVAVDPESGVVFQTEDRDDGLIYRFLPGQRGKLAHGGQLQALKVLDQPCCDARNWGKGDTIHVGQKLAVDWIDMDEVDSPDDDLRHRGFESGAARFARGEGMWYGRGAVYFACTSGGEKKVGQIWRYTPSPDEGNGREKEARGSLELFVESGDAKLLENADNLTVAPWGDLIVCEDRSGQVVRVLGVTAQGQLYTFAHSHMRTEFAGVTFSPDGSTLFVNIQGEGMTFAITGPWQDRQPV